MKNRFFGIYLGLLMLVISVLSACSKPGGQEPVATMEMQSGIETDALEQTGPEQDETQQDETQQGEIQQSETHQDQIHQDGTNLPEDSPEWVRFQGEKISKVLATSDWNKKAVYLPEFQQKLDAEGVIYKGFYNCSGERLDLELSDGTQVIFLSTRSMEGREYGYELMMYDEQFNKNGFQENYLNFYDVIVDQEYYPETRLEMGDSIENFIDINQTNLSIARNEVFARHGREFQDPFLNAVFQTKSWYQPKYSGSEFSEKQSELLSEAEKKNLRTIINLEQSYGYRLPDGEKGKLPECLLSGSYLDLDGDGKREKISYSTVTSSATLEETYTLTVGESTKTGQGENLYQELFVSSLDGKTIQLLAAASGPSDDYTMDIYHYEDGRLQLMGTLGGSPEDTYVNGNRFSTTFQHDFFQTWLTREYYEIQNGTIQRIDMGWYEFGNEAIAIAEIPLYKGRGEMQIAVTLHAGDGVIILGTDNKEWVCIEKKDSGERGWLRCEGKDEGGYTCIWPDGSESESYELFEGLSFYG